MIFAGWWFFRKPRHTFPDEDKLVMHFIDVGQGDCTFIAANGVTMLVDCGEYAVSSDVVSYLKDLGVGRLDYLIGTHPHSDHMGGMARIIDTFDIGEVLIPSIPDEQLPTAVFFDRFLESCEAKKLNIRTARTGDTLSIGKAVSEIVSPDDAVFEDMNNYSVSLLIRHGDNSFLLTGDSESEAEYAMLTSDRLQKVTLYKAGHHGSSRSSTAEFLDMIRPQTAVISCGADNPYGHPSDITLQRLHEYTDKIYRTDICGNIVFESDGSKLSVRTERNGK
ncbi:MAG: MBL fold metallo-hydrolase [Ruminococcus sp.]|uniref:ComEC/Rec2 family competence protein n=1 Tax=Ruminococcus sp. TaxID=41978 RepID=UPI0025DAF8DF|nr:ComEC/Rec2 family competence protein [Ruminococcus sp.]MBR5681854.1 MBL fold metallo-hydrolase [Ruminococcus sp.]